ATEALEATRPRTSASLQKPTSERLPCYVRLVPKADICGAVKCIAVRSPHRRLASQEGNSAATTRTALISAACKAYHRLNEPSVSRKSAVAKRLRGFLEVSDLCIEGALEGGPRRAAVDIGGEVLVAGDDVRVLQDAQNRRHHEIASREAVAVEKGLVAQRFGQAGETPLSEIHGTRSPQLRPFLVRVEKVDQRNIHEEGLDG